MAFIFYQIHDIIVIYTFVQGDDITMDYLINMNRRLRITLLYSLFMILIPLGVFLDKLLIVGTGFVVLGLLIYTNIKYTDKVRSSLDKSLNEALIKHNFKSDNSYLSHDYLSGIAINEELEQVALFQRRNQNDEFSFSLVNFDDIIESSISEDEITVTKASKAGVIGGALVGGVLAGGIGAAIGGLTTNKTSTGKVSKITLAIVIDDLHDPVYYINFLNNPSPIDKGTELYDAINKHIDKWHRTISVILKRNELNSKSV